MCGLGHKTMSVSLNLLSFTYFCARSDLRYACAGRKAEWRNGVELVRYQAASQFEEVAGPPGMMDPGLCQIMLTYSAPRPLITAGTVRTTSFTSYQIERFCK